MPASSTSATPTALTPGATASGTPPSIPAPRPRTRGIGLAWRIFIGTAATVVVVLGATLIVASIVAKKNAEASIRRGLDETAARISDKLTQERWAMQLGAKLFAEGTGFRSTVESAPKAGDTASVLDQAKQAD